MKPGNSTSHGCAWLGMALLPLGAFLALAWGLNAQPLPWRLTLAWIPSLDVELAFHIDALSAQMLALITGIGVAVFVYAAGYMAHVPNRHRVFLTLPVFMIAMIGAVSADHVIVLFGFWELTSITSFLLVGFNHQQSEARDSARQALLITMGGGLALLGGLILLSQMAGSWLLSEIIEAAPGFTDDPRLPWAIVLVLTGAFTKSAQFPFHFWLPNAMSAPTPVSAYLHSATMVKLGIYLMARLDPAFNAVWLWEALLVGAGTVTAVWGASLALLERDLKRILARGTVSALGTMTVLIGLTNPGSGLAAMTFMVAHALYKAPLFMVAGNIDHATGTRSIDHLMGLRRVMPGTMVIAVLAGLSMAGLPLTFGFVAKDIVGLAKVEAELYFLVGYALVLVSALAAALAGVAAIRVFWGRLETPQDKVHKLHWTLLLPPLVIALVGIEMEFFPSLADPLLVPAAQVVSPGLAVTDLDKSLELGDWLSANAIALATGLVLFLFWDRLHDAVRRMTWLRRFGPEAAYAQLLGGLARVAAWHTQLMQAGRLDRYLNWTLAAVLLMAGLGAALVQFTAVASPPLAQEMLWRWPPQAAAWLVASVLMASGALAAALVRGRLAALMASGLVGYGAAVLFLFAGAPDLAFTQFSVETVLVIVAAAVLTRFAPAPRRVPLLRAPSRLLLALAAGIGTCVLLLQLQGLPAQRELSSWIGENSLLAAYGHNAVNVILVDFRALDTFGESVVVAFALLAALPLLAGAVRSRPRPASPLMARAALPLYWMMLGVSLWLLLRGHNAPGGGFIGGLVAATASSLLAILREPRVARRYQPLDPLPLALIGIGLALLSGLAGAVWGDGFLRHLWWGGLSTAMQFDLGVFCVVWGTLTGYVYALLGDAGRADRPVVHSVSPEDAQ